MLLCALFETDFEKNEDKALKLVMQGKQITVNKARSKSATDRDRALRTADINVTFRERC